MAKLNTNPWFTMWYKPRETIRAIIKYNPKYLVIVLAMVSAFSGTLDSASYKSVGDYVSLTQIFAVALIVGPIIGLASLYISSWLLRWTGRWIGGRASSEHIRTAIAWSTVPLIWALILWIPELALFGEELFTSFTPAIDTSLSLTILLLLFGIIEIVIGIWTIIIYLKSLGEVQGFSAWKALLNSILSTLVILIPILIIATLAVILFINGVYSKW